MTDNTQELDEILSKSKQIVTTNYAEISKWSAIAHLELTEEAKQNIIDFVSSLTADRKRVALDKEEMTLRYAIQTLQDTNKEFALENLQRQLDKNLAQQEEV